MTEWHQEFHEWLANNKPRLEKIQELYSKNHLRAITRGTVKLEQIPPGKRLRLYEITGLDFFKVPIDIHPMDLNPSKIITGQQPKDLIQLRIEYDNVEKTRIASEIGVDRKQFSRYIENLHIMDEGRTKIEVGLQKIYGKEVPTLEVSLPPIQEVQEESQGLIRLVENLDSHVKDIGYLIASRAPSYVAAEILASIQPTTKEQRKKATKLAIGVLADLMDYYREASQEEREDLAREIDSNEWGYVAGVLPKIDQPRSYQTVLRLMPRPPKRRKD